MSETMIRIVSPEDAEQLLDIYAPYIRDTAVTFEYTVPSAEEFKERIRHTLERFPYLAAVRDGEIIGYVYAGPLHPRAAYAWSAETSIYVKKDKKNQGTGKLLYEALEKVLKEQNILSVNACIAYPEVEDEYLTKDSVRFHLHMGYKMAAEFHKCAYKFGHWYNMVWMEKHIGDHIENPAKPKTFKEVRGRFYQWER
ncbi:GNAT family N-acetyltransferase [Blautia sp.]|jgi:L-amino acid N-acyltransferase YncA|uniref:GNAT family N-acetyltransferase n=1 Tax=Blautia sp. TaxID=1955243 RepID=UPI002941CD9C|nr:N-acetyltransferase family protein [uncultured Blautia sp.]